MDDRRPNIVHVILQVVARSRMMSRAVVEERNVHGSAEASRGDGIMDSQPVSARATSAR